MIRKIRRKYEKERDKDDKISWVNIVIAKLTNTIWVNFVNP